MIIVEVGVPLVGEVHALGSGEVINYANVINLFDETSCTFLVQYNGLEYTGVIARSEDETQLLVSFDNPPSGDIVLPAGMCLIASCEAGGGGGEPGEEACPNQQITITNDTKLAVLDENGCQIGFTTISDIIDLVIAGLNIPTELCDLIPGGITEGSLVAADRVLTTQNGCDLKSIPQDSITCE